MQVCLLTVALEGCKSEPMAAGSGPRVHVQDDQAQRILTPHDEAQVERAFSGLATDHAIVQVPVPAAFGVRWEDVKLAVVYSCDDAQMAVASTIEHGWGYEFQLKTIEDYPGVLTVKRLGAPRVYQASARIGEFNDHPDRAAELLAAFDRQMRAFGKKRQFND